MKTQIGPIYLILGLMAVATLSIGAADSRALGPTQAVQVAPQAPAPAGFTFEFKGAKARAFQATSPGMAMPGRLVVIVSDKLDAEVQERVGTALAQARARRKAG